MWTVYGEKRLVDFCCCLFRQKSLGMFSARYHSAVLTPVRITWKIMAVSRYWRQKYGAVPIMLGRDTLQFYLKIQKILRSSTIRKFKS